MESALNMNGFNISNVQYPKLNEDCSNKIYVDTEIENVNSKFN